MNYRLIGKWRVLCVLTVYLLYTFLTGKEVYANERTIDIYIGEETAGQGVRIEGDRLGNTAALLPGGSVRTGLRIHNDTEDELYICWECAAEDRETELYHSLQMQLYDCSGSIVYEGNAGDFAFISGPGKKKSTENWTAVLILPPETGNRTAGEKMSFDLILSFSDSPAFENRNTEKGSSGTAAGEGSGMGHRYFTAVPESGPADFTSARFQRDEEGNPLLLSAYSRDGLTAPRSGFAFEGRYIGGGSPNIYAAPLGILLQGIDSGQWVLVDREKHHWKYILSDGSYLKGGFALVRNPYCGRAGVYRWYYFEVNGIMAAGWIKTPGEIWYHAHEIPDGDLGALETGWITDSEDGELYYTSEQTAAMLTGWVGFMQNDGNCTYSYFARQEDTFRRNWFYSTAIGRWVYDRLGHRSYGSMYKEELTPDHYRVDRDGIRVEPEYESEEKQTQERETGRK